MIEFYINECIKFIRAAPDCNSDKRIIIVCYAFCNDIEDKELTVGEKAYICAESFVRFKQFEEKFDNISVIN